MPEAVRKQHTDAEAEHRFTSSLLRRAANEQRSLVHAWRPHPQVAFGRRDRAATGYSDARKAAERHGLEVTERTVGGRAVVHTGGTAAFAVALPIEDMADGLHARYRRVTDVVQELLGDFAGGEVLCRDHPRSFCPGEYSLSIDGRKVAGVAQRVRRDAALVSGVVVVGDRENTAEVLRDVYGALDLEFDPGSVGALRSHGVDLDPGVVAGRLESGLCRGL